MADFDSQLEYCMCAAQPIEIDIRKVRQMAVSMAPCVSYLVLLDWQLTFYPMAGVRN